ncbi:MAG TPA: AEC family transporter [Chloroflexia bacterium]|nr:AEC family transporter [Chloroflexia bacterium]
MSIITNLGPLFAVIVIGALLKTLGILPAEAAPLIARVVMTLTLPALVFTSMRRAYDEGIQITPGLLIQIPLLAYLVIAASGGLAWLAGRALELDRPQKGALMLASMFGSTAFLGYPLFEELARLQKIGATGSVAHVVYSEIGTLVALVTVGLMVASVYGEGAELTWRNLLAVPRAAPFIALAIGLLFYNDPLWPVITDLMKLMGSTTSFLMMLYLGMSIVGSGLLAYWKPILASQAIKLLFAPLLALILAVLFQMNGENKDLLLVAVIDSSTPSILLCLAYAAQYKLDLRLATALVFSSFVFSLLTMGIWLALVIQ